MLFFGPISIIKNLSILILPSKFQSKMRIYVS